MRLERKHIKSISYKKCWKTKVLQLMYRHMFNLIDDLNIQIRDSHKTRGKE